MKIIETEYRNYRFRSRLEARWAVFFDKAGIEWEYEPEGFVLADGTWYLPDFLLKNISGRNLWAEVKGALSELDKRKIRQMDSCICLGNIPDCNNVFAYMKDVTKQMEESNGFVFSESGKEPSILVADKNGKLGLFGNGHDFSCEKTEEIIIPALKSARQERFESETRKSKQEQINKDAKADFCIFDDLIFTCSREVYMEIEKELEELFFSKEAYYADMKCKELSEKYLVDQRKVKCEYERIRKKHLSECAKIESSKEWLSVLALMEDKLPFPDYMLLSNYENLSGIFDNGSLTLYPKNELVFELIRGNIFKNVERLVRQALGENVKVEICTLSERVGKNDLRRSQENPASGYHA